MEYFTIINLIVLLSLSSAFAAINTTDFSINDIKNALPEGVSLPPELENIPIPNAEDATKLFKDKCIKESGSDAAFEEAQQALTNLVDCAQSIVNFTALPDEIEQAKPNGNLDTVFNKYCNRRSEGLECVESFTKSLDPCLTEEEKDQKVVLVNITKSLLEFVCHDNGNQIALFIAEEGPECFSSKQEELQECFRTTMGKYSNESLPTVENLPSLIIKEENCRDMDKLEACAVKELETCKESTPANLVESLFRFVRKETPCAKFKKVGEKNSSETSKLSVNVLLGTWLMALIAKFLISSQ